jgi:hypothetical protein
VPATLAPRQRLLLPLRSGWRVPHGRTEPCKTRPSARPQYLPQLRLLSCSECLPPRRERLDVIKLVSIACHAASLDISFDGVGLCCFPARAHGSGGCGSLGRPVATGTSNKTVNAALTSSLHHSRLRRSPTRGLADCLPSNVQGRLIHRSLLRGLPGEQLVRNFWPYSTCPVAIGTGRCAPHWRVGS